MQAKLLPKTIKKALTGLSRSVQLQCKIYLLETECSTTRFFKISFYFFNRRLKLDLTENCLRCMATEKVYWLSQFHKENCVTKLGFVMR